MVSPEVLVERRQAFLRQPFLGEPLSPRSLSEMRDVIGKGAKLVAEGGAQKLIYSSKGKDKLTGETVNSITTYNELGFIESIRSSRKGRPTTIVEYTYRPYEGPDVTVDGGRYEIAQTQTYLETASTRRRSAQREQIETGKFDWVEEEQEGGQRKKVVERTFESYEGHPLKNRLDGGIYGGWWSIYGSAEVDATAVIQDARELAAASSSYKVIDGPNGVVVEALMPARSNLTFGPVGNLVFRKTFDKQGRITQFETRTESLRPGIDYSTSEVITYSYENGYMTSVTITNSQTPDNNFYNISHNRDLIGPTGPVVVIDEMRMGSGINLESSQVDVVVSLAMLTHNNQIDAETQQYIRLIGSDIKDETLPNGTILRHIKMSTLPLGQELVVENPGPNGQLSVRLLPQTAE